MESIKTLAQILASFPDNSLKLVTAEQLRDYVVSISAFGGKRIAVTGTQMIGTTFEIVEFDATGLLRGVTSQPNTLTVPVNGDGDYEVTFNTHALLQNNRAIGISVAINGIVTDALTSGAGTGNIQGMAGAIVKSLVAGDIVSIFALATGADTDFFMGIGSAFSIKRLL